jgi:HAD superfamily hydrolase (TIGR01509 family)
MRMKIIEVPEYIRGLIFDCDGTLIDSMPLHMKAWEHAITQADGEWDYDFIFSKKGMQGKDILASYNESFGMKLDVEYTARLKQEYFRKYCAEMKPIDAVVNVVHRYASRLPMAIASGGSRENVLLSLELIGIKEYFTVIITADDKDVPPKPSPEIFLEAARRIHVNPQLCQVFEDGDIGLEAARMAGMVATDIRES